MAVEARRWKSGGRQRSTTAAGVMQSECALTLMNAGFRRNLTGTLPGSFCTKHVAASSTNDCDRIQFDRTNETRKWAWIPHHLSNTVIDGHGEPAGIVERVLAQHRDEDAQPAIDDTPEGPAVPMASRP